MEMLNISVLVIKFMIDRVKIDLLIFVEVLLVCKFVLFNSVFNFVNKLCFIVLILVNKSLVLF